MPNWVEGIGMGLLAATGGYAAKKGELAGKDTERIQKDIERKQKDELEQAKEERAKQWQLTLMELDHSTRQSEAQDEFARNGGDAAVKLKMDATRAQIAQAQAQTGKAYAEGVEAKVDKQKKAEIVAARGKYAKLAALIESGGGLASGGLSEKVRDEYLAARNFLLANDPDWFSKVSGSTETRTVLDDTGTPKTTHVTKPGSVPAVATAGQSGIQSHLNYRPGSGLGR